MPDIPIGTMLPWQWAEDEPTSKHGEGISRPRPRARTRQYRVVVYPRGAQPMLWTTQAENVKAAIRYAQNRWPGAEVEVA
jgi:hypothetical protein